MPLLNTAEALYVGHTPVDAVYVGSQIVWSAVPRRLPNLIGWYDETSPLTVVDGKVAQWNDKSGAGNHLGQGTAANRPIPVTVKGRRAIKFDGVDDRLSCAGLTIPMNGETAYTVAGVLVGGPAGNGFVWSTQPTSTSKGSAWFSIADGSKINIRSWNTIDSPTYAGTAINNVTTGPFQLVHIWDVPARRVRIKSNGGALQTAGAGTAPVASAPGTYIMGARSTGGLNPSNCTWCEKIICAGVLTTQQIADVEKYLRAKWGAY